jgi:hypothetical protein
VAGVLAIVGFAAGGVMPLGELETARADLNQLQSEMADSEAALASTQEELSTVSDDYAGLQESFDSQIAEITRDTERLEAQLEARAATLDRREDSLADRAAELNAQESDVAARERKLNIIEQSSFGNGTWQVGADITPGVYRAAGGTNCYWAILNSTDTFDIATNGVMVNNPTVTLTAGKWFETDGCGEWSKIG